MNRKEVQEETAKRLKGIISPEEIAKATGLSLTVCSNFRKSKPITI